MPHFFETISGRKFYEDTAPRIASALERIAAALEVLSWQPPEVARELGSIARRRHRGDLPGTSPALRVDPPAVLEP